MSAQSFFRAVNLKSDIEKPSRLSHYQPTGRSTAVINAVLGQDASIVIAAYGSGKSLAAGIGALIARNDAAAKSALKPVLARLKSVDPALHAQARARMATGARGRVVVLTGYVPDPTAEIAKALGIPTTVKGLDHILKWIAKHIRADRVAIVWDEFGRHLEGLVTDGQARDLDIVQRLAEWAARAQKPAASFTILLHQNLLAYAGSLNQTSRNEWRKIEGRFRQIRFIEDSREVYTLVADRIASRRKRAPNDATKTALRRASSKAVQNRWFDDAKSEAEVNALLQAAYPLSAGALQVLPRIAARIAQSERSLFSFIEESDLSGPIGLEEVYRYFAEAMRADIGPGGTHRRWIETESARSRADNDVEREILAAACLFQLGANGERRSLPVRALKAAVMSRGTSPAVVQASIRSLLDRKLLLHRHVNDDVSVWHGIDVDIVGRLAEERAQHADTFNVIDFLNSRHPAPIIRATRHNVNFGTSRYLLGRFILDSEFAPGSPRTAADADEWGTVLFVLADTAEAIAAANQAAATIPGAERIIVVIPRKPLAVIDAALEVFALERLKEDAAFVAQDPLVGPEIDEFLAVARQHLSIVLHRLTTDRPVEAVWWYSGSRLNVTADRSASIIASDLMDLWYPATPRVSNDQMMRQRLSRQMTTARVRILMRIMEHASAPMLGYGQQDTSVEASVYRTVLERTGLHMEREGGWWFAAPEQISDDGLRQAWRKVAEFFSIPTHGPRPLSDLTKMLSAPPTGMPAGIIPIIIMAGYRAFARVVSLRTDEVYVPDLLGFGSNRMFSDPERHSIEIHESSEVTVRYLSELAYVFTHQRPTEREEVLRFVYDAFGRWCAALPEGARRSGRLSTDTQRLLREISKPVDPAGLFLRTLPSDFGGDFDRVIAVVERARNEIDSVVEGYMNDAVAATEAAFRLSSGGGAVTALQAWVSCLDVESLLARDDLRLTDKAVLRTARDTTNGRYTPQSLARTVSAILLQRGVEQWQDSTAGQYSLAIRECRARIEDAALAAGSADRRFAPVIRNRIAALEAMLERLSGKDLRLIAAGGGQV